MFKVWALRAAVAITVAGRVSTVRADAYDAPLTYYKTATATDAATLKAQLKSILTRSSTDDNGNAVTFRAISYGNVGDALVTIDQDPNNSSNVLLIYNRGSALKSNVKSSGTAGWNKEHIFPNSKLGGDSAPGHSDEHNLRPAQPQLNGTRSNYAYGGTSDTPGLDANSHFSPGAADRGDAARAVFYMATRYSDGTTTPSENNLQLVNTPNPESATYYMGDLHSLLVYHYQDLPDSYDRRRNAVAYNGAGTLSQGNRNPYTDHPEYVWAVFGGGANDSKISVATPAANGASSKRVAFTPVIVGGSVGTLTQSVAVSKTGADPTTYSVAASGAATSSANGIYNAFNFDPAATSITVGLNATSSTAGRQSGTVTIDNTDLTTAGTGAGSADGNDTIDVSLDVLDHSNASFAGASDKNTLSINFDSVGQGTSLSKTFSLYNLLATSGFTAGLDIDKVTPAGDTGVFDTDLMTLLNLAGGDSAAYQATFMPKTAGVFSATYTLAVSDQNLAGATNGTSLTLTLNGTAVVPEPMGIAGLLVLGVALRRRSR